MDGGSRASEIVNLVHLYVRRHRDVVTVKFKIGVVEQVYDIGLAAREIIVHTDDLVPLLKQRFAKMRAKETGPSCN